MKTLIRPFYLILLLLIACEKDRVNNPNTIETIDLEDITIKSYPNGINNVFDLFFIDETTGFVVGQDGMIKKTTSAGKTWISLKSGTTVDLNSVCFINGSIGFVGSDFIRKGDNFCSILLKTVDGGLNWTKDTISNVTRFQDIWFFNENDGIAFLQTTSYDALVSITNNGGATWNNLNLSVSRNNWSWDRIFVGNNACYIIGGADNQTLYKSLDFGKSWVSIRTPILLNGVNFVSNETGYIKGE